MVVYFEEIKIAAANNRQLWDKNLYGNILLINPETRQLYANDFDSSGILKFNGKVYEGMLPKNMNIANTSINWGGKDWAMIMLPLPENKNDRIN